MKKEVRQLRAKAINALVLSVDHFNRPWDCGRTEAVLIMMDHSFEMLLKSAIRHKGGKIRKAREKQTIGFDACVRRGLSDANVKFLTDEQALTLQTINGQRDAAQHYLIDMSEHQLYFYAQAGVTLFRDIHDDIFEKKLVLELPERVLPISTTAPKDLVALFDKEIDEILGLLTPGTRKNGCRCKGAEFGRAGKRGEWRLRTAERPRTGEGLQASRGRREMAHRLPRRGVDQHCG